MTSDSEDGSVVPPPGNPQRDETPPVGIVSVNDRGRRQSGRLGPFILMGGVALVVLIGGLLTVNVVKARLAGPKRAPATPNASASGLARTFGTDEAPPIPGTADSPLQPRAAQSAACPDGTAGNELRGRDGVVVRNAAGQSVRVCADGQVVGVSPTPSSAAQPVPIVASGRAAPGVNTREYRSVPALSEGAMMLNGGKYGAAPLLAALAGSQAPAEALSQADAALRPKTEGLLTTPAAGSLEAELEPSRTPMVAAARLSDLNLLLPKGRTIACGMSMRIVSTLAGQANCVVTQNVFSANGKVLLIERGSEAVGEYRSGISIGQKRLFVLWNRILTPAGVVINLNSPGADELGSTGLRGSVDDHWFERIGSAFLLSTIQDAIQYEIAAQQAGSGSTTLVFGNTAQAGNQMAQKVLDTTINIPATLYKNQGDRAVIYVARDLDFSNVYRLRAQP